MVLGAALKRSTWTADGVCARWPEVTLALLVAVALCVASANAARADEASDWSSALKHIPLGPNADSYVDFGGELRERVNYYSAPVFGLGGSKQTYLLHRLLLSADVHVDDDLRVFVQLGNHLEAGKDKPLSPPDQDRGDIQQAFLDVRLGAPDALTFRAGRQELSFGSDRVVSTREPLNVRRSFDGVSLFGTVSGVKVEAFAVRPVLLKQGYFDDEPDASQGFWGVYATIPSWAAANVDLYYFGYTNRRARYGAVTDREERHSLGARIFGHAAGWDWNFESLGQFGTFANQRIRSWTLASDTGYTLTELSWAPRLGLKANIASGDHDPHDRVLGTFNPLFPKYGYFSDADLISPSNFFDLQPTLTVKPTKTLTLTAGWDFLWRQTTADAVYTSPGLPVKGTAGQGGRYTGSQGEISAAWQPLRHIEVKASYVHFFVGSGLTTAAGRDVDFVTTSIAYKF